MSAAAAAGTGAASSSGKGPQASLEALCRRLKERKDATDRDLEQWIAACLETWYYRLYDCAQLTEDRVEPSPCVARINAEDCKRVPQEVWPKIRDAMKDHDNARQTKVDVQVRALQSRMLGLQQHFDAPAESSGGVDHYVLSELQKQSDPGVKEIVHQHGFCEHVLQCVNGVWLDWALLQYDDAIRTAIGDERVLDELATMRIMAAYIGSAVPLRAAELHAFHSRQVTASLAWLTKRFQQYTTLLAQLIKTRQQQHADQLADTFKALLARGPHASTSKADDLRAAAEARAQKQAENQRRQQEERARAAEAARRKDEEDAQAAVAALKARKEQAKSDARRKQEALERQKSAKAKRLALEAQAREASETQGRPSGGSGKTGKGKGKATTGTAATIRAPIVVPVQRGPVLPPYIDHQENAQAQACLVSTHIDHRLDKAKQFASTGRAAAQLQLQTELLAFARLTYPNARDVTDAIRVRQEMATAVHSVWPQAHVILGGSRKLIGLNDKHQYELGLHLPSADYDFAVVPPAAAAADRDAALQTLFQALDKSRLFYRTTSRTTVLRRENKALLEISPPEGDIEATAVLAKRSSAERQREMMIRHIGPEVVHAASAPSLIKGKLSDKPWIGIDTRLSGAEATSETQQSASMLYQLVAADWQVIRALVLPLKQIFAAEDAKHVAYQGETDEAPRLTSYPLLLMAIAYVHRYTQHCTNDAQHQAISAGLKRNLGAIFAEMVEFYAKEFDARTMYIQPIRAGVRGRPHMAFQSRQHMPEGLQRSLGAAAAISRPNSEHARPLVVDPSGQHGNAASACQNWANAQRVFGQIAARIEKALAAETVQAGILPVNWHVRPWDDAIAAAPQVARDRQQHNERNAEAAKAAAHLRTHDPALAWVAQPKPAQPTAAWYGPGEQLGRAPVKPPTHQAWFKHNFRPVPMVASSS